MQRPPMTPEQKAIAQKASRARYHLAHPGAAAVSTKKWREAHPEYKVGRAHHVDHVQAISKGGLHNEGNIQLLCPQCNRGKRARDFSEFLRLSGFAP